MKFNNNENVFSEQIPSVFVEREIDCDLGVVLALDSPVDISHSGVLILSRKPLGVKIGLINEIARTDEYYVNKRNSTRIFGPIKIAASGKTSRNNENGQILERKNNRRTQMHVLVKLWQYFSLKGQNWFRNEAFWTVKD